MTSMENIRLGGRCEKHLCPKPCEQCAAPTTQAPQQEPIAVVTRFHDLGGEIDWTGRAIAPAGAKLCLAPQPGQSLGADVDAILRDLKQLASEVCDHTPDSFQRGVVRLANRAHTLATQPQEAAPLSKTFVQMVPDKCDRIVWRNGYYHLPSSVAPAQDAEDAARLDWIERHARYDPKMDGNHVYWPMNFNECIKGPNLRAAIDAARAEETKAKGTK